MLMLSNYWAMMDGKQRKQISWIVSGMMIATFACMVVLFATDAFAATNNSNIFATVGDKFRGIYTSIGVVVTALAAIALAICGIRWIMSSDPTSVRTAKTWMLNIAIGLAVYWLAYIIINTVGDITGGKATTGNIGG